MKNSIFNKKSLNLIKELTIAEFKLRDQGSILGFLWTLLHPLLVFIVLYLLFSKWTGKFVDNFGGYLLIGIVQWNFFAGTTTYVMDVLVRRRELMKNLSFPKEILIISTVLTSLASHILEFLVLLVFLFFIGNAFTLKALLLPLIMLIELMLIIAVSFVISTLYLFYRDIARIWQILLMLGFFATPVFYSLSMLSAKMQRLLLLNPLANIINSTRAALLGTFNINISSLIFTLIFSLGLLILAYSIFRKQSKWFAEAI